ncbi:MAG: type IV pilus modification protein PilV [Burkholderiales bacterium]|jgi:type IV pilus assembly protein PilV|nr:type IV pilus modification protein PilV [Burkholderiales bacterium]
MLNRGFTLLEVLITLIILMFGLLGLAGLMAKGQRASFEAFQRQQALSYATDIAERMRSNRALAAEYAAAAPLLAPVGNGVRFAQIGGAVRNCGTSTCTPAETVAYDVAQWDGSLAGASESEVVGGARVAGILRANGCVAATGAAIGACPAPPATPAGRFFFGQRYTVSVAWQGRDATSVPANSTCGAGQYGNELQRRVVTLDVMVQIPCP